MQRRIEWLARSESNAVTNRMVELRGFFVILRKSSNLLAKADALRVYASHDLASLEGN